MDSEKELLFLRYKQDTEHQVALSVMLCLIYLTNCLGTILHVIICFSSCFLTTETKMGH